MKKAIIKKRWILPNISFGTGALPDPDDNRDLKFDGMALAAPAVDWQVGYDVENKLDIKIKIKNQDSSSSCVGQAWSYYIAVLNAAEVGFYDEVSAKGVYSQIFLPSGGAYLRDGGKLAVNWGAVSEIVLPSYDKGNAPGEGFMTDKSWKNPSIDKVAQKLQAKEYRTIDADHSMELFAIAIRDNNGVVGGVNGDNNGTWSSFEPKPPKSTEWGHALFFGKFGMDSMGKYIATPNSWGARGTPDALHKDGWQKLREDYFASGNMFSPWTLTDKPNFSTTPQTLELMKKFEKKIIIESGGIGRKGIIINGILRPIAKDRVAEATLYTLANNNLGSFVSTQQFDEMTKGNNF